MTWCSFSPTTQVAPELSMHELACWWLLACSASHQQRRLWHKAVCRGNQMQSRSTSKQIVRPAVVSEAEQA